MLSIFFLNNEIKPKKEDRPAINERILPDLKLVSPSGGEVEPVLLAREIIKPDELSREAVAEAARNADALLIDPYSEVALSFAKKEKSFSMAEWDRKTGKESEKLPNTIFQAGGPSAVKIFIIRVKWPESGPATYVARVRIKKMHSYQDLFSGDREKYTVLKLLPQNDRELNLPPVNTPFFEERRIGGTLELLQQTFPELGISKLPSYFVFHKGIKIAATEDESELQRFLSESTTITHAGKSENWEAEFISKQELGKGLAVLSVKYVGKEEIPPSNIPLYMEGTEWNLDRYIEFLDENRQGMVKIDFEQLIRKEDNISLTIKWHANEETIYLTHAGNY
ncbi:hypothetical protein [Bacillus sp. FJAT-27245]|uniref:hypothetical protein n=1 Tax=Bacillus sp. FJAT-27245 TaxID=1684144 RepID=UPI000A72505D|nr:hypothetical protein [Bacillus sp. FJAT-27245]